MRSRTREMPAWVVSDLLDRIDGLEAVVLDLMGSLPAFFADSVSQIYLQRMGETTDELFKRKRANSGDLGVDDSADL